LENAVIDASNLEALQALHGCPPDDAPTVDLDDDAPTNKPDLERILKLANLQVAQERVVEELEELLDRAKAALRRTREADLPEAMSLFGTSFTLNDGHTIEVVKEIFAGIPKGK
jgi:hypothetical protein